MLEIGPIHPLSYREELVSALFKLIKAKESCCIVGAASMGKSRLLQFVLRADVRQHYLGQMTTTTLFAWVDCNRMSQISEWGFYELVLTTLTEVVGEMHTVANIRDELNHMRREAILEENALLAQRYLELAIQMFCQEQQLNLCLILDEFDESLRSLPDQTLANLRAIRDRHKFMLSFVLFLRDHPKQIRSPIDSEGFYELISRSVLGLVPYNKVDTRRVIQQVIARRNHEVAMVTPDTIEQLIDLSGGHPGLVSALIDNLIKSLPLGITWQDWAYGSDTIKEECRKIWDGLHSKERQALHLLANELTPYTSEISNSLILKGILIELNAQEYQFFSPLFKTYSSQQVPKMEAFLYFDIDSGEISVNGKRCNLLTPQENELFCHLYERRGKLCDISDIIAHLYPGQQQFNVNDNTIAALIKRIRSKIEPDPKHPLFLLNIKGRGYKLVEAPE